MGKVELNFRPKVPVFDANIALGRRHDRRVKIDTREGTLEAMDHSGINRAVAYSPHAATFDSKDGNDLLIESIGNEKRLVPQFVCNPTYDDLYDFASEVKRHAIRSIRLVPNLHNYPFVGWIVDPWLDWLAGEKLPVWIPTEETEPVTLYETIKNHPDLLVVLTEVKYHDSPWVLPLLRNLTNVRIEISRFIGGRGIEKLISTISDQRILFGSRFPDSQMSAQLYHLHLCGLSAESLTSICSDNLERLLGLK